MYGIEMNTGLCTMDPSFRYPYEQNFNKNTHDSPAATTEDKKHMFWSKEERNTLMGGSQLGLAKWIDTLHNTYASPDTTTERKM